MVDQWIHKSSDKLLLSLRFQWPQDASTGGHRLTICFELNFSYRKWSMLINFHMSYCKAFCTQFGCFLAHWIQSTKLFSSLSNKFIIKFHANSAVKFRAKFRRISKYIPKIPKHQLRIVPTRHALYNLLKIFHSWF